MPRLPFDGSYTITSPFGDSPYPIAIKNPDGSDFSSQFNDGQLHHAGTDWGMEVGVPILATEGGVVTFAGDNGTAGKEVRIQGDTGVWRYLHNSQLLVGAGAQIAEGQVIAKSGNTGYTTGPHLHIYLSRGGKYVDPEAFIGNSGGDMVDQVLLDLIYDAALHRGAGGDPGSASWLGKPVADVLRGVIASKEHQDIVQRASQSPAKELKKGTYFVS